MVQPHFTEEASARQGKEHRSPRESFGRREAGHWREEGGGRETSIINDLSQPGSFLIKFC